MINMIRLRNLNKAGLTLIELLVVVSLVMMIGLGVYKTLVSGISIYNWFLANAPQNDAEIFLEKVSYDLKNIFPGSLAVFCGTSDKISFFVHDTDYALLDPMKALSKNIQEEPPLYSVEYKFNSSENSVTRKTYRFGDGALKDKNVVLNHVRDLNFGFCTIDSITKKLSDFVPVAGNYPAAVKISIEMELSSQKVNSYNKIVEIPVNLT